MTFEDPDLIAEFVIEAKEHLGDIENQLLQIEAGGAEVDIELVNTVFRAIHSVKGAAGFFGLLSIKDLAHSLESVLNLMREQKLVPSSAIVDVLLRSADTLAGLVDNVEGSLTADVSEFVAALETIVAGGPNGAVAVVEPIATPCEESAEAAIRAEPTGPFETLESSTSPSTNEPTESKSAAGPVGSDKKPSTSASGHIRVSVGTLDHLMNLAGELVLGRNQLQQLVGELGSTALDNVSMHINQVTSELQEAIMQTRMQPIGTVFTRFTRVVRDLSSQLGKECQLDLEGQDVEVDKTIVEAIGDPLTHLVRNSVDHGIEAPADRAAAGKSTVGTLRLSARHKSGKVSIEIADDGAGIDPEKLKASALKKGLITPEQAKQMSDREAIRLIFHAGFSTANTLTDVSGRGVGMDVVRRNIEKLGGLVEVDSQLGKGTTIHVTLPLTLAIIPSLIVRCGDSRFAVSQVNIAELVRLRPAEIASRIGTVKDAEVLRLRGTLLPLVRLRECLEIASPNAKRQALTDSEEAINIIVVESGPIRYGLVVDGLFDSEEIVVKPLGRHLKASPCLAGATILGDGRVALILDVAGIASQAELTSAEDEEEQEATVEEEGSIGSSEEQTVLLFTNEPTEQFAVPMTMITRIERIGKDQIDSVGGHDLLQYRGSSLPLLNLEDVITAKPRPDRNNLYVIVFEAAGSEIGLVAPDLVDIRNVPANFETLTFHEQGICGSQVIEGHTTRAIDLLQVARCFRPQWFQREDPVNQGEDALGGAGSLATKPTLLLAEDSPFFRRQVTAVLELEGYQVIACEDGKIAWDTLQAGCADVDIVLTDIEMPNMNGLQLCRRIRDDEQLQHLPVVALTSLAGQEDRMRGAEAGIDEYQVKLDRERLLSSVRRLAPQHATLPAGSSA